MSKSFYDLDYIIEISEKRLAEYTALYQKVLERLTNIILVYSALGIFLVPLTQHVLSTDINGVWFYIFFVLFVSLLLTSLFYLIKLLLPVEIAYLEPPYTYYIRYKTEMKQLYPDDEQKVDDSIKSTYISDLKNAIDINIGVYRRKSSFFYNALVFALLAIVPYTACVIFHLSKEDNKGQKVMIWYEKNRNFI